MVRFYVFLPLPNLLDLLTSIVMLLVAPKFYLQAGSLLGCCCALCCDDAEGWRARTPTTTCPSVVKTEGCFLTTFSKAMNAAIMADGILCLWYIRRGFQ